MDFLHALSDQAAFINSSVIPWVLRLVMIGLGLSLRVADFKRVLVYPKAVTLGLVAQLIGLPFLAFGLALLFNAPPTVAMGLVIVASCPSGVTSNAYTFAARADVPLCVTLSALTSIITVFTIPFLINVGFQTFAVDGELNALPVSQMMLELVGYTLVPLSLGMLIRAWFPSSAEKAVEPIRKSILSLMTFVLILGVVSSYQEIADHFATVGALAIAMNLLSMGMGYGLARLMRLPTAQVITLTFEVGVQNLALTFAITFSMLQRPDLAVVGLLYAAVMPATALSFVTIARRLIVADRQTANAVG